MALQLITAFLGSFGFSLLFHVRGKKLFFAALGGLLSWVFYLLLRPKVEALLIASILASCFSAAYAEIMAWLVKAPATVFIIPSVIPLVPGGSLYYAMYSAVIGDAKSLSAHEH